MPSLRWVEDIQVVHKLKRSRYSYDENELEDPDALNIGYNALVNGEIYWIDEETSNDLWNFGVPEKYLKIPKEGFEKEDD